MKLLKYLTSFAAVAGMLSACTTDLDTVEALPIENATPATIHALTEDIVVTADNQDQEFTFSWDAADFGAPTPVNYSILADYEGNSLVLFSGITKTSFTTTLGQLNQRLYNDLSLPADEPSAVAFSIGATIGSNYETIYSETSTVNVTVTTSEKQYPVIYVIGDYCGWDFAKAQNLYSFTEDEENYEGFVDFGEKAANGFKLSGADKWDDSCNWGTDGEAEAPAAEASSVQLINSGGSGNLQCYSKRFYKFAFTRSALLLEVKNSFDQLGIVGGFTNWADGADVVMDFNPAKRRFWADVENLSGEFKFRADGGWDVNWGAGEGENALAPGGGNINVAEAGNYRVYAYLSNSNELYYELDAKMYGQPEMDEPDTPDVPDEPDKPVEKENLWDVIGAVNGTTWSGAAAYMNEAGPGVWYSSFVEVEGEFKFRYNNSWDVQIGKGAQELAGDGSLCAGSNDGGSGNFSLEPGTYQFILYTETNEVRAIAIDGSGWGVIGALAGFNWDTDLMMYEAENGLLAAQGIALTAANQFKFREANAWTKSYGYGAMTPDSVVDGVSDNGANITVSEDGVYDLYLDLDNGKIYVMTAGTPVSNATAPGEISIDLTGYTWCLCGTFTNWSDSEPMAVEGDFAVAKGVSVTTADEFKLKVYQDTAWSLSYGSDTVVEINKGTELTQTQNNIKISANGTYDIYFGLKSACIYVMEAGQKPAL